MVYEWEIRGHHLGNKNRLPSGKLTICYGKSSFLMGKSTISMAIFNSKLSNYPRVLELRVLKAQYHHCWFINVFACPKERQFCMSGRLANEPVIVWPVL